MLNIVTCCLRHLIDILVQCALVHRLLSGIVCFYQPWFFFKIAKSLFAIDSSNLLWKLKVR